MIANHGILIVFNEVVSYAASDLHHKFNKHAIGTNSSITRGIAPTLDLIFSMSLSACDLEECHGYI